MPRNLAMALKLSPSFSLVSMEKRESSVKCFCLFIKFSFLLGGNNHIYTEEYNRKFGRIKFYHEKVSCLHDLIPQRGGIYFCN